MLSDKIYSKKIDGKGILNFIFIHNAGGCHKMFSYQIDVLLMHGNVILLDLPGHSSSLPAKHNNIEYSSKLIYDICRHYSLENVWLIGLNNGANIAINTVHMNHMKYCGMILIDPPLFMRKEFVTEINLFINQLTSDTYAEFCTFNGCRLACRFKSSQSRYCP